MAKQMPPPPTRAESLEFAEQFLEIVCCHAVGDISKTTELLESFYSNNGEAQYALRIHYFAVVGPLLVSVGMRRLMPPAPEGGYYGLKPPNTTEDPHELAVMQMATAYLNNDEQAAQAICSAHHAVHEIHGLFDLVLRAIAIASGLANQGAYGPPPRLEADS